MASALGQPVVIENRPGASAVIGADALTKADPDGYTLMMADSSAFAILPHIRRQMPYDARTDFAPITVIARQAAVLTSRPSLPAKTVKELIAYAKERPGEVTFGSFGIGSWAHVAMEDFARRAGIKLLHVPYRGSAQVVTDMLGDRVDLFLATHGLVSQHISNGKINLLATATETRLPARPDVPTVSEAGLPGFAVNVWFGLVAPAKTPPAILEKLRETVVEVLKNPEFQTKVLAAQSLEAGGETREEFLKLMLSDLDRWGAVVKEINLKID
jgi:tripartite-type tricarboxylate transporter receptor subunit TctC